MTTPEERRATRRVRMEVAAERTRDTLDGRFSGIYEELKGLDPDQVNAITPDTTAEDEYDRLIAIVQEATQQNLEQAELVSRIRTLGNTAIEIAKLVPSLRPSFL